MKKSIKYTVFFFVVLLNVSNVYSTENKESSTETKDSRIIRIETVLKNVDAHLNKRISKVEKLKEQNPIHFNLGMNLGLNLNFSFLGLLLDIPLSNKFSILVDPDFLFTQDFNTLFVKTAAGFKINNFILNGNLNVYFGTTLGVYFSAKGLDKSRVLFNLNSFGGIEVFFGNYSQLAFMEAGYSLGGKVKRNTGEDIYVGNCIYINAGFRWVF